MNKAVRMRRVATALVAGAATTLGLAVAAAPAQATPTPFTLRMTAVHSGKSLTASSADVGSAVFQSTYFGTANQKWRFNFTGGSIAQIVNEDSHLCMQPENSGASLVRLQICDDPNDITHPSTQFWKQRQTLFNGKVVNRWENVTTGMYLDISGASQSNGALLIQFPPTGGSNQLFSHAIVP